MFASPPWLLNRKAITMYVMFKSFLKTTEFRNVSNEMWLDPVITLQSEMNGKVVEDLKNAEYVIYKCQEERVRICWENNCFKFWMQTF